MPLSGTLPPVLSADAAEPRGEDISSDLAHPASGSGMARRAAFNSARLGGALLVSWVLALAGRLLIPNQLGRDRFGELTFVESVSAIVMSVVGFGVGSYIQREVTIRREHAAEFAHPLIRFRLMVGGVLSLSVGAVFWITSGSAIAGLALCFAVAQLAVLIGATTMTFLDAIQQAGAVSAASITTKLIWIALLVTGLLVKPALIVVPIALLVSEVFRTVWLQRTFLRYFTPDRDAPMSAAVDVVKKSTPYYVNTLNVVFMSYSVPIIVKSVAGVSANGLFSAAIVAQAIPLLFAPVLLSVFTPVLSKVRTISSELMWERVQVLIDHLAVPLVAIGVAGFGLSSVVVGLLFDDREFSGAASPFALLALAIPATYLTVILGLSFVADGKAWHNTRINIATMLLVVVGVIVAVGAGGGSPARQATVAAAVLAGGEWLTMALQLAGRPPGRLSRGTTIRLGLLGLATLAGALGHWTDLGPGLTVACVATAVIVGASEAARLLRFVRVLLGA